VYDSVIRKMQVDYFPGENKRDTYYFDYQRQARALFRMNGVVDPTRRSYKRALAKQKKRDEAEARGEEVKPVAIGQDSLHPEDMLILDNEDFIWKECTNWDLSSPYNSMCLTDCFRKIKDPSVGTFPENSVSDEGGSLDPYQDSKDVFVFATGYIPSYEESGKEADPDEHPPRSVRYTGLRNNTPILIEMADSQWKFFRWVDYSEWDAFDLKDSGLLQSLTKPSTNCIYFGNFAKDVEDELQPSIPIPLIVPGGSDEEDED